MRFDFYIVYSTIRFNSGVPIKFVQIKKNDFMEYTYKSITFFFTINNHTMQITISSSTRDT